MHKNKAQKLVIQIPLIKLNEYIKMERSNRYAAAEIKKAEKEQLGWIIKMQLKNIKFTAPVFMEYFWYEPNCKRDKDNCTFPRKVIQDALVDMRVLPNDGWNDISGFKDHFEIDKENPRIEVLISDYFNES